MNATRHSVVAIVTHGVALLIGVLLVVGSSKELGFPERQDERAIHKTDRADDSAEWIQGKLQALREEADAKELEQGLPLDELLQKERGEADAWKKELHEEVDRIVTAARNYKLEADPADAIRAALRGNGDPKVILQAWLDRDPDAALAELGRNWKLVEADEIPEMLNRKFGNEWILGQIGNSGTPYRLRAALTSGLARQLAWENGLDALRQHHTSISDPQLKTRLVSMFALYWPLEDPVKAARFLADENPVELRKQLWEEFASPANALPDDVRILWFGKLCEVLGPDQVPETYWNNQVMRRADAMFYESMSHEKAVNERLESASAEERISFKVGHALNAGTDLEELYGEGMISRQELLEELRRRVHVPDSQVDLLEREAWQRAAGVSDPQEAWAWAKDLSRRHDMADLMMRAFVSNGVHGDPRIANRLARYRILANEMGDGKLRSGILQAESNDWRQWKNISPSAADAWRKALPPSDPLHEMLRSDEEGGP